MALEKYYTWIGGQQVPYYEWNGHQVANEVRRIAGLGLKAAAIHLSRRVKETISIAAARAMFTYKGSTTYIALTSALPGAAPRKLSGQLRRSITWDATTDGSTARVGSNLVYARSLEFGYTAKAGTWFPFPAAALVARGLSKKKTQRAGAGEIVWIKRKVDKKIPPHPFLSVALNRYAAELALIMGQEFSSSVGRTG